MTNLNLDTDMDSRLILSTNTPKINMVSSSSPSTQGRAIAKCLSSSSSTSTTPQLVNITSNPTQLSKITVDINSNPNTPTMDRGTIDKRFDY
jgi:hypothetical protein